MQILILFISIAAFFSCIFSLTGTSNVPILVFDNEGLFDQPQFISKPNWKRVFYFKGPNYALSSSELNISPHIKVILSKGKNSVAYFKIEIDEHTDNLVTKKLSSAQIQDLQQSILDGIMSDSWAEIYVPMLIELKKVQIQKNMGYQYNFQLNTYNTFNDFQRYEIKNPYYGISLKQLEIIALTTKTKHYLGLSHSSLFDAGALVKKLFPQTNEPFSVIVYLVLILGLLGLEIYMWIKIILFKMNYWG